MEQCLTDIIGPWHLETATFRRTICVYIGVPDDWHSIPLSCFSSFLLHGGPDHGYFLVHGHFFVYNNKVECVMETKVDIKLSIIPIYSVSLKQ